MNSEVGMASRIEDYGFISNMHGAGLVSRDGALDWLCVPRFDSDACMAALIGREEHGCWRIHPGAEVRRVQRRYRPGTMILDTDWDCEGGVVRVTEFMPTGESGQTSVVRIVEGVEGAVPVDTSLIARFGYGRSRPWLRQDGGGVRLTVAPDSLVLHTPAALALGAHDAHAVFTVKKGERVPFELSWRSAFEAAPPPLDTSALLVETERWWSQWCGRSSYRGEYRDAVSRSLVTLKALTYAPTGGIVAAPTASLPEDLGGVRNWDYRYCWLRDATLTLNALMAGGYVDEAKAWRAWFYDAIAGAPDELQIMYGIDGNRRLTELETPWLPGYEESRPVRIGNAASEQFQLDVYGEVIQALYEARRHGMPELPATLPTLLDLAKFVESSWQRPDDGIWEVRGGRRHFVHSKMMAWVAFDRLTRTLEEFYPHEERAIAALPHLRALRGIVHKDICDHGFDRKEGTFTQSYGSKALDASLLLMPALGFLPGDDPRVQGTIRAVERTLLRDGFVLRYATAEAKDGLTGGEGAFLACSFWLVDAYAYSGRRREAEALFERLLKVRSDLGLLSEEYDPTSIRLLSNFPQAFSHLALIHSACVLSGVEGTMRAAA
jgi:GH15 family glucan-1,4-alpha-glucosidase